MTKDELLKRAKEVITYYTIKGWGDWLKNDYHTSGRDMLRIEDLENSENMLNFLVELVNIMEKYNIGYSGVNGMLCNFRTPANDDNAIRVGVSKLYYFFLTQEEMNKKTEEAKEYAYQKMLSNRVKFLLPDNLKCKQSEDEHYFEGKPIECEDKETGDIELHVFRAEFTADIETHVELNHIETFTDENDIKNTICKEIANTIYQSTFYQIDVKNNTDLINKIQLKELETDSTTNGIKTYSVLIKGLLFKYLECYNSESYDVTQYSLNKSIIKLCERTNIENNINITNIEITEPKWLLDEPNNDGFFESDTEVDDRDDEDDEYEELCDEADEYEELCDEDDEYEELCDYDAIGSFIADIELNIRKVESNDVDEDLINTCYEKVYDILESDGVSIDSDEDELFERIKIKELEDGMTLVTIKDVECSVRVFIEAHNLDEANDERWSAFNKIIRSLKYLKNIRDEYVSEAD